MKILLLNLYSRNALAVLESANPSYDFMAADIGPQTWLHKLADGFFTHKRVKKAFRYRDPVTLPDEFAEDIIRICKDNGIDAVLPTGTEASNVLSSQKDRITAELPNLTLCIDTFENLEVLTDKWLFYKQCLAYDIPVAIAASVQSKADLEEAINTVTFPVVFKPTRAFASAGLEFFDTADEFRAFADTFDFSDERFILQSRIEGTLYDIAFVSTAGKTIGKYAQSRTVGVYDFGGGGAMVEPVPLPEDVTGKLEKMLIDLGWSGIAEFDLIKHAVTGELMPIECNPKIWGTTLTTTLSGANFIQANFDAYLHGNDTPISSQYREDILMRYWFPEGFMHVFFQKNMLRNLAARWGRMTQNPDKKTVHSNLKFKYIRHHLGMCFNQLGGMIQRD